MEVKAIYFDLFETLISEFENGQRKAPRSTHMVEQLGVDTKIFDNEWKLRQEKRMDGSYSDFPSVIRDIFSKMGHEVHDDRIETLHTQRKASKLIPFNKIDLRILSMLEQIKKLGLKIGLMSNCTPEEVIGWESSPLAAYFDDTIFSYQVKLAKPNPLIYHLACERLGVSPSESLFIGDGGSNELEGAAKVGMSSYHATWFLPTYISERITNYTKLREPSELIELVYQK
ncbi:HAD-IA family hydrolase [Paenibacillus qinlingensis]|uniref:Hydrolase of the HAD superfamily n=1 Tax=Paenibacillus qinlingensis TaxID=1837343 RepID=A0ABU1NRX8_9BACL|nr:HAD-IA family hydrolase [Paenibacillus qinlingensis]MDR6550199.1 putative hydrolase of the HAD superfamily [Paenibacillus qinlingensis]